MKPKFWRNILIAFAAAVLLLAVIPYAIFALQPDPAPTPTPSPTPPQSFDAAVMCQIYVDEQLKAPRTAEHPVIDEASIQSEDGYFLVTSYVDSENSFGAMIRTGYKCLIEHDGDGWNLIALKFDE